MSLERLLLVQKKTLKTHKCVPFSKGDIRYVCLRFATIPRKHFPMDCWNTVAILLMDDLDRI